ncbi:YCII-related domain protein [Posidoniimonas polymericola]|uniref:YCII-related domain protein n=1 Tax=Posidoniimonas polymericola TaxID=2528002 RepID=A0A5C5YHR1_9BACT|nr:YciI family protein [Posidoniimonas polymericola]TWT74445.1 YCII-related domain protein [Posidoniimonas polymericola]
MKYLLLMYNREDAFTAEEMPVEMQNALAICHELHVESKYVAASPLEPVATAKSVRIRKGEGAVVDGPFAETKEQLGGYVLIDVPTLDEAIEVAARFPSAFRGTVEIRPLEEPPA